MIQTREQARRAAASGDAEAALAFWRHLLQGNAGADDLLEFLRLLLAVFRFREACALLPRLLNHPQAAPAQLLAASSLLFSRHRIREAVPFTARALQLEPDNPDTAAIHAACLERSGDAAAARALLEETLQRHPGHLRSVRLLAHLDRLAGNAPAAAERLQQALRTRQTAEDWRLRYELAPALEQCGDARGAMQELLLAKEQLRPLARPHLAAARGIAQRQWEVTCALDAAMLTRWAGTAIHQSWHAPEKVCLLAGFPRSGTTLLESILTTVPGCLGTDESGILAGQFRDPLVLMAPSAEAAVAELDGFSPEDLDAGRAEYFRCTEEYLGEPVGGRILIEKEPLLTADLAVPLRLFPDAGILMPLRDPRDVIISFFFTIVPLGASSAGAISLEESCRCYAEVMRHWLRLRDVIPSHRWLESRYEDLLAGPEFHTRRLADFLGCEWTPAMLSHHRKSSTRAVSTPTYADVSRPLYTRAMGRWHSYEEWLAPHLPALAPFLKAFGYE